MKKGFTLVELLAVLVVLGVIALIAIPTILNVVEDSRKGAFKDSASGLIESAELYYTQYAGQEVEIDLSDDKIIKELNFKGTPPDGGKLYFNKSGDIALEMYNSKYCAYKSYADRDVQIKEGKCNFNNLWRISAENIKTPAGEFPKVVNGVTIDFDPETQIYTLNGTSISGGMSYDEYYIPSEISLSQNYTISSIYISGTGPDNDSKVLIAGLDLVKKSNGNFNRFTDRQFIEVRLLNKNGSLSRTLTYPSTDINNGYRLYFYFRNAGVVFKDYKFKVMLNKGSKQEWVKNLFTTN